MKLGIDADPIGHDGSGNETYLRGLIGSMGDLSAPGEELVLFGSRPRALEEMRVGRSRVVGCAEGFRGELTLGLAMRRNNVDVVLAHYNLPLALGKPAATIVHDVSFLRVPDTFARTQTLRLRLSVRRSVLHSQATVTVSEFSKQELLDCYPALEENNVVVAPNAAAQCYFSEPSPHEMSSVRKKYRLPAEFLLSVGNVQPRKNLARAAEAAARVGVPMVAVGQRHGKRLEGPVGNVNWLGYVPGGDLPALYRLCSVFCYVSLYEGFGLPVLEALASGAVVVTSNTSAMPEVAGRAAVLADPGSVDSIVEALASALGDAEVRKRLEKEGPERAGSYSWTSSAQRVLERVRQMSA